MHGWIPAVLDLLGMGSSAITSSATPVVLTGTWSVSTCTGTWGVLSHTGTWSVPSHTGTWS